MRALRSLVCACALACAALAASPARADSPIDLLDGLVAWYPLDEASGVRYDAHLGDRDLTRSPPMARIYRWHSTARPCCRPRLVVAGSSSP